MGSNPIFEYRATWLWSWIKIWLTWLCKPGVIGLCGLTRTHAWGIGNSALGNTTLETKPLIFATVYAVLLNMSFMKWSSRLAIWLFVLTVTFINVSWSYNGHAVIVGNSISLANNLLQSESNMQININEMIEPPLPRSTKISLNSTLTCSWQILSVPSMSLQPYIRNIWNRQQMRWILNLSRSPLPCCQQCG